MAFFAPCIPGARGVGWSQRTYQFLAAYARIGAVDLVAVDLDGSGVLCSRRALDRMCASTAIATTAEWAAIADRAVALASRCDLIHITRTFLFDLAIRARKPTAPVVVDLDEEPVAGSSSIRRCERTLRVRHEPFRPTPAQSAASLRAIRDQADLIWVCSQLEISKLRSARRRRGAVVRCVPNAAPLREPALDPSRAPPCTLLFVGNLNFVPNVEGLRFLIEDVLPIVQAVVPKVELHVVGRGPGTELLRRATRGVRVSVDVRDVAPHYRRATVAVAPIRYGAGTRVKILEAFGQGVPVVSTAFGCEGLGVRSGEHLIIADDARSFARACIRLFEDAPLRVDLARRARPIAARNAPAAVQALILSHVQEVMAGT